ncbi:MAG: PP2C family protein-serine/threonine phosphatase [Phycisphaerales bacterium]
MSEHSVAFVTSGNVDTAWSRWAERIRTAWPRPTPPHLEWLPLEVFRESLAESQPRGPVGHPKAALIVIGTDVLPFQIDRLVESLLMRNVPAICLMQDPADWQRFQRAGVIFEAHDASPTRLAAMLYALCERQPAVEAIASDLFVLQRAQGGIRLEMDRIHDELHLAATVQRELIPVQLPKVAGMELGVIFRPVNYVSGDVYAVELLDVEHLGFFVADAVGHGVPAALLTMALCHNLVTREFTGEGLGTRIIDPADVLARLNLKLCESRQNSSRFATAVYGVVHIPSRRVTIAGAGHPPPIIVSDTDRREVETDGPLLGVFPDAEYTQAEAMLADDETLLVFTDGLECAFPDPTLAPEQMRKASRRYVDQLTRLARAHHGEDLPRMIMELGAALDAQAGSLHQADDVTTLAISPTRQAAKKAA